MTRKLGIAGMLALLGACAPVGALQVPDNSQRIEDAMRPEKPNAPIPEGVAMGSDAPPLAVPDPSPSYGGRWGWGTGGGFIGRGFGGTPIRTQVSSGSHGSHVGLLP